MKKTLSIEEANLPKHLKKKVTALNRGSFYFIKGYKIDEVPLQLTHFYKNYIRFKILAWPYDRDNNQVSPLQALIRRKDDITLIRESRVKYSHAPTKKINPAMVKRDRINIHKENQAKKMDVKGYVNFSYNTLKKAEYITFEKIADEDLPLFIGDTKKWTHLTNVLGM